jgi:ferredoxin
MNSTSAEIYVFSGAGNTFVAAKKTAEVLRDNGCPTTLHPIPGRFFPAREGCALGLAFPVACGATYPFVLNFLYDLPDGEGREAFFITSLAGAAPGVQEPVRRLLARKHYQPLGFCIVKMPSNYGKNVNPASVDNQSLLKKGAATAANFAGQLLVGKTHWPAKMAFLAGFFHNLAKGRKPWQMFRRFFPLLINEQRCVRCGFCLSICPAGAIARDEQARFAINAAACVSCQHCAAFCPHNAIGIKGDCRKSARVVAYDDIESALER